MIKSKKFLTRGEVFPDYSKEKESVLIEAISISNLFNSRCIEVENLNKKKSRLEKDKVFFKFFNLFEKRKVNNRLFIKDVLFFMLVFPCLVFSLLFTISLSMSDAKGLLNKYPEQEIIEYSNFVSQNSFNPSKLSLVEQEKYEVVKYHRNLSGALFNLIMFVCLSSFYILFNIIEYVYIKSFKEKLWLSDYNKTLKEIEFLSIEIYSLENSYKSLLKNNPFIKNNSVMKVLLEIYKTSDLFLNEINKKTFALVYSQDLNNCFNSQIKDNYFFSVQGTEHINEINNNLNFYRKS